MTVVICDSPKILVIVDFEFRQLDGREGNPVEVVCGVFKNLLTGEVLRIWQDELYQLPAPPFFDNPDVVLVAYYASAELACFRTLNWTQSVPVLDLYAEFRTHTNGLDLPNGRSLIGALQFFRLSATESSHKDAMRELALRGGPYTAQEKINLLDYCAADVAMTEKLLLAMSNTIDYPRAFVRGQFCIPLAAMESHGSPIDY